MALILKNLQKVAGGAQSLYLYNTTDVIGTVQGAAYFANAAVQLKQNDVIICVSGVGGTVNIDNLVVTSTDFNATPVVSAVEGVTTS